MMEGGRAIKYLVALVSVAAGVLIGALGQSNAELLKTMDAVGTAILECWKAPSNSEGSSVTLSFSFKRDGTLIGPPKPTAIDVKGDEKSRQVYVDAAVEALQRCLPLSFSPGLAEGIAGNVFTMEFTSSGN